MFHQEKKLRRGAIAKTPRRFLEVVTYQATTPQTLVTRAWTQRPWQAGRPEPEPPPHAAWTHTP